MSGSTKVPCDPNPDIAGIGIVVSFTIGALVTLVLSILCFSLKWRSIHREAERFANAHPCPHRWARPIVEDFWPLLLDDHPLWLVPPKRHKNIGKWHRILEDILLGISMSQLLQAFALILCSLGTYGFSMKDPHAAIALGLSTLSAFSQLQVPFVLQAPSSKSTIFRTASIVVFQLLVVALDVAHVQAKWNTEKAYNKLEGVAVGTDVATSVVLSVIFLDLMLPKQAARNGFWRSQPLRFALTTWIALANTSSTLYALYTVKFSQQHGCDLSTPEENKWTLGQIMAVVMLIGLVLPGLDSYFDKSEEFESEENSELVPLDQLGADAQAMTMEFEPDMPSVNRLSRRTTTRVESQE